MESLLLEAFQRQTAVKARQIRKQGRIPAIYYGVGRKNLSLELDYHKFRKIFEKAGENTIIELAFDSKKIPVLVYDIQYDPVTDAISHVDFIHVDMEKEVTTTVKVVVVGVAPVVKNLGGVLDVQKHEIKIKCLPKDLIHSIEVDVSPIVDYHTSIHVKDLKVPSTIKVLDNPDDTVATATPLKKEEEKPAEAAAAVPGAEAAPGAAGQPPAGTGQAAAAAGAGAGASPAQPAAKEAKK